MARPAASDRRPSRRAGTALALGVALAAASCGSPTPGPPSARPSAREASRSPRASGSPAPSASSTSGSEHGTLVVEPVASPAPDGSAYPRLATEGRRTVLCWVEHGERGVAVRQAERDGEGWTEPATVVEGASVLGNWADVPVVAPRGATGLVAAWTESVPGGEESSAVRVSVAADGRTWTTPASAHGDASATEHGFASVAAWAGDDVAVVWLDGRQRGADGQGDMALRVAILGGDGAPGTDEPLDARTCECCPTAAVRAADAILVAYRDRSDDETRDIAVVRHVGGAWSSPVTVHDDGWRIAGCPVNGPALAADGPRVALAWFTGARDEAAVNVAFSDDAGATWSEPTRVDAGHPAGGVTLAIDGDGAVVGWLEAAADSSAFLAARVDRRGTVDQPVEIARVPAGRAAGSPRLARAGDEILAAWTESDGGRPRVRTARLGTR